MAKQEAKVVTVDEGDGPVRVVKDRGGRIITKEQLALLKDKQQADLDRATELRNKLVARDAEAVSEITGQVRDRLERRSQTLARQKTQVDEKLAKLEAKDAETVGEVVDQMVRRLSRRAERIAASRDRSQALIDEIEATGPAA